MLPATSGFGGRPVVFSFGSRTSTLDPDRPMETLLVLVIAVVVIAGALAFSGAIKAATVVARFVFYIGLVVLLGLLIAYFIV